MKKIWGKVLALAVAAAMAVMPAASVFGAESEAVETEAATETVEETVPETEAANETVAETVPETEAANETEETEEETAFLTDDSVSTIVTEEFKTPEKNKEADFAEAGETFKAFAAALDTSKNESSSNDLSDKQQHYKAAYEYLYQWLSEKENGTYYYDNIMLSISNDQIIWMCHRASENNLIDFFGGFLVDSTGVVNDTAMFSIKCSSLTDADATCGAIITPELCDPWNDMTYSFKVLERGVNCPYSAGELISTASVFFNYSLAFFLDRNFGNVRIGDFGFLTADIVKDGDVHTWDEGVITKPPTLEEEGERTYTCTVCGSHKTEIVPKSHVAVTSITLNMTEAEIPTSKTIKESPYTITEPSTLQLSAVIEPEDAYNKSVTWSSSNPEVASVDENGLVTALTYGKTTITASAEYGSKEASCEIRTRYHDVAGSPNKDDDNYQYFFTPVYWAADNNITKGYGNIYFGPDENCTREQMITFLYRTAGSPAVSGSVSFSDVKKGSYYYNAVLWAYKNNITKGYSDGTFGVGRTISREDTVTFIYRMAGTPRYSAEKSFYDVKRGKYYYDAVLWAAKNKITNGYADGSFGVGKNVLRKDIVTFLYRFDKLYDQGALPDSYVNTPKLINISNEIGSVKVSWEKISGASQYRVYRKVGSGSWEKLVDTAAVTYTDKSVTSGTKYSYTVRCLDYAGNSISSYNSSGISITYVAPPVISSVTNTRTGAKISWGKVTGAAKYRVYRKTGSGSWGKAGDTTSTSYTDTTGKNGTTYYYTVRCLNSAGNPVSSYDSAGKSIKYQKLTMTANKTNVTLSVTDKDYAEIIITYTGGGTLYTEFDNNNIIDKCILEEEEVNGYSYSSSNYTGSKTGYEFRNTKIHLMIYPGRTPGTTYLTLTNSTSSESIKIKVTVTCPVTVSLPSLPQNIINYNSSGSVTQRGTVTDMSYLCEKLVGEGYKFTFNVEGTKTYDSQGQNQSRAFRIGFKLYDSDDYVVYTRTVSTESVTMGEKYKTSFHFYIYSDTETNYRVELLNVN